MKEINVALLSAGRRVELVKCFLNAKKELNIKGNIVGVDMSNDAPALQFCDIKENICPIKNEEYIESIIKIVKKHNIVLIVPTIDTDLQKLADNREYIYAETGAKVLISNSKAIKVCRDKLSTIDYFNANGFGCPELITDYNNVKDKDFPLFVKPNGGSSSINTFKINNKKELDFFVDYVKEPIVQRFVKGAEYTVDCFVDFDGDIISIVPRKRISVRAGEILKGKIDLDKTIIEDVTRLIKSLKFIGQITVQLIKNDEGIFHIEINPRFGGGAPMSIKAGANSPLALYKILLGEKLEYNNDVKDGLTICRFDDSVVIND